MRRIGLLVALLSLALAGLVGPASSEGWRPSQIISGAGAESPDVASTPAGRTVAAWSEEHKAGGRVITVSERRRGGSWGKPRPISASGRKATEPTVATGAKGHVAVGWQESPVDDSEAPDA